MNNRTVFAMAIIAGLLLAAVPLGMASPDESIQSQNRNQYQTQSYGEDSHVENESSDEDADDDDIDEEEDDNEVDDVDDEDERGSSATNRIAIRVREGEDDEAAKKRAEITNRLIAQKKKELRSHDTYAEAKKRYQTSKHAWLRAQERYRNASSANVSQERVLDAAKDYMLATLDATISYLETIQERVGDSGLPETEKERIMTAIDDDIDTLEGLKARIESATSRSELAQLNREVKQEMNEIKRRARKHLRHMVDRRIDHLLAKLETAADRVEDKLDRLEERGIDVSEARELLEELRERIDEARRAETYEQQRNAIRAIQETLKELFKAIRDAIQTSAPAALSAAAA